MIKFNYIKEIVKKEARRMYFYGRIRDLREDNDKKQAEIASVLEITTQQYQLYESGKIEIPVHHLIKLSAFYNVSIDYLLGLIPSPEPLDRYTVGKKKR